MENEMLVPLEKPSRDIDFANDYYKELERAQEFAEQARFAAIEAAKNYGYAVEHAKLALKARPRSVSVPKIISQLRKFSDPMFTIQHDNTLWNQFGYAKEEK